MKLKHQPLGHFELCHVAVEVILDWQDSGGYFFFNPNCKSPPRIRVGCAAEWPNVVATLLHEATEFALSMYSARFIPDTCHSNDHSQYLFSFTHSTFSTTCSSVGMFLSNVLPPLAALYNKRRK